MNEFNRLVCNSSTTDVMNYLNSLDVGTVDLDYALILACTADKFDMVKLLLDLGADIHYDNESALETAIYITNLDLIKYLIKMDANVNRISLACKKSIIESTNLNSISIITYLFDVGLELDMELFCHAVHCKKLDVFKLFYQRKPDIDLSELWKVACQKNSVQIIEYMLELPFDPDLTNKCLMICIISANHIILLKKIINRISDPKILINPTVFKYSCIMCNYEIIKLLLELGINPDNSETDIESEFGIFNQDFRKNHIKTMELIAKSTPLEIAIISEYGNLEVIKLLVDYGAKITIDCLLDSINSSDWEIFTFIYLNGLWNHNQLSQALLEAIKYYSEEKYWQFLQEEIGDCLEDFYLEKIITEILSHDNSEELKYFIDVYGWQKVGKWIDLELYGHLLDEE